MILFFSNHSEVKRESVERESSTLCEYAHLHRIHQTPVYWYNFLHLGQLEMIVIPRSLFQM